MDNEKLENLIRKIDVSLGEEEKADLKKNLLLKMEDFKPSTVMTPPEKSISIWRFFNTSSLKYSLAALIPILVLASTASAAQGSLPGDLLYSFKTGFNEKLSGIFYLTDVSKAKRETELLERRLKEAQKLAFLGELSEDRKQAVEKQFDKHSQKVRNYVSSLKSQDDFREALALQSDLEISLELHGRLLASAESETSSEVQSVASKVAQELSFVSQEKVEIARNLSKKPKSDALLLSQERLKEAKKLLKEVEELPREEKQATEALTLTATATPDAMPETSLNTGSAGSAVSTEMPVSTRSTWESRAKDKIKEGRVLLEVKLYREAINAFNEAIKILKEVKLAEESEIQLDIFSESSFEEGNVNRVTETTDVKSRLDLENKEKGTVRGKFQSE